MITIKCVDCSRTIAHGDKQPEVIVCPMCYHVRKRGTGDRIKRYRFDKKLLGQNKQTRGDDDD